jgi:DNA-binding MarR family transcriptional regulator
MDLDPARLDVPVLVSLAAVSLQERAREWLVADGLAGVRPSHGFVFQHLVERSPTIGELADALGVTQQAASKVVVELEGLGHVERRTDEVDSRVRRAALTEAGRDVVARGREHRARLEADLVTRHGQEAVDAARKVLVGMLELTGGLTDVSHRSVRPPSD